MNKKSTWEGVRMETKSFSKFPYIGNPKADSAALIELAMRDQINPILRSVVSRVDGQDPLTSASNFVEYCSAAKLCLIGIAIAIIAITAAVVFATIGYLPPVGGIPPCLVGLMALLWMRRSLLRSAYHKNMGGAYLMYTMRQLWKNSPCKDSLKDSSLDEDTLRNWAETSLLLGAGKVVSCEENLRIVSATKRESEIKKAKDEWSKAQEEYYSRHALFSCLGLIAEDDAEICLHELSLQITK